MTEHELLEALRDLENDAAGRKFTDDEKHRWNERNEELDEYRKRRERLLELARNPRNREEGSVVDPNGGSFAHITHATSTHSCLIEKVVLRS